VYKANYYFIRRLCVPHITVIIKSFDCRRGVCLDANKDRERETHTFNNQIELFIG